MRKGTYQQYKKRHDADVKAGRAKGPALDRKAWEYYHHHHDASHGEDSHQKAYRKSLSKARVRQAEADHYKKTDYIDHRPFESEAKAHKDAAGGHHEVHKHVSQKKDGHHALRPAHTHHDVHDMMNKHNLEEDDATELKNFKKAKSDQGQTLSPTELMRRFLQKAKPETKERMKGMDPADFMKMYAAILDDEEPGAAKAATAPRIVRMSKYINEAASLRERTIRLAHENPELREHLLPLLKEGGSIEKTARFGVESVNMHMKGGFASFTYKIPSIVEDLSRIMKKAKDLESLVNGGKVAKAIQSVCQKYTKGGAKCVVSVYTNPIMVVDMSLVCDAEIKYDAFPTDADFQPVKAQFTKDMQKALSSIR